MTWFLRLNTNLPDIEQLIVAEAASILAEGIEQWLESERRTASVEEKLRQYGEPKEGSSKWRY